MDKSTAAPLLIHGAGGHAKVVYAIASILGREVLGFYDPLSELFELYGLPVHKGNPFRSDAENIIAIGNNDVRMMAAEKELGRFTNLIHPWAIIGPDVTMGIGNVICAGAVIQPGTKIGNHCIINTKASVDHDCYIGDYNHVAPGATVCGGVSIGNNVLIGAGSTIIPGIKVNNRATLAAGGVAIEEIFAGETWGGVPAKYLP